MCGAPVLDNHLKTRDLRVHQLNETVNEQDHIHCLHVSCRVVIHCGNTNWGIRDVIGSHREVFDIKAFCHVDRY